MQADLPTIGSRGKKSTATDERLLAAFDEIELLREQIEFCQSLVESQNQELHYKEQQLQETERELEQTNNELVDALITGKICFAEANALAKTIVAREKSASECLAELLNIIYGVPVTSVELVGPISRSSITTIPSTSALTNEIVANSRKLRERSHLFATQFNELGVRFVSFKAHFRQLQESMSKLKKSGREKNVCTENFESAPLSYASPPLQHSKAK